MLCFKALGSSDEASLQTEIKVLSRCNRVCIPNTIPNRLHTPASPTNWAYNTIPNAINHVLKAIPKMLKLNCIQNKFIFRVYPTGYVKHNSQHTNLVPAVPKRVVLSGIGNNIPVLSVIPKTGIK